MEGMILVQLNNSGIVQFYQAGNLILKVGDQVIVEHDRGLDCGCVIPAGHAHCCAEDIPKEPPKKIIRLAKESDLKQVGDNTIKAKKHLMPVKKRSWSIN